MVLNFPQDTNYYLPADREVMINNHKNAICTNKCTQKHFSDWEWNVCISVAALKLPRATLHKHSDHSSTFRALIVQSQYNQTHQSTFLTAHSCHKFIYFTEHFSYYTQQRHFNESSNTSGCGLFVCAHIFGQQHPAFVGHPNHLPLWGSRALTISVWGKYITLENKGVQGQQGLSLSNISLNFKITQDWRKQLSWPLTRPVFCHFM